MVNSWQSAVCGAFAGAKDYIILGKTKEGEKNVKILSMQKQHSSEIPDCLEEESSTSLRKECLGGVVGGGTPAKKVSA